MSNSYYLGKNYEDVATEFLLSQGYSILTRNYRTKFGEIDIIAFYENILIFIEVKARKQSSLYRGIFAVDSKKQNKIIKTAEIYLYKNKITNNCRFDVIEITDIKGRYEIKHYKNAFIKNYD